MAQSPRRVTPMSGRNLDCAAVDFDLSTDQQALRAAAATLLDRMAGHDALRARVGTGSVVGTLPGAGDAATAGAVDAGHRNQAHRADAPRGYDAGVWAAMADQGWLAIEVPADEGGLGLGTVEVAVLCEEIGRRLVAAPFLPSVLALGAFSGVQARADAATKDWREALGEGAAVGCVAFAPAAGGVTATPSGSDGRVRLSGETPPTAFAPSADVAVVVAGGSVYAVDVRSEGQPDPVPAMDRTRELGILAFDGTPALCLGGADTAQLLWDRAATLASVEMLGSADHVLSMTVDYAKDRVQFGKPIGSFQAVKHMLADALVDVEGMRSTVYYAAWCVAADDRDRSLASSMAKAWCSDASRRRHGGRAAGARRHRVHLGARHAPVREASPARPGELRRCGLPPGPDRRHPA